jgi:putative transcription factor
MLVCHNCQKLGQPYQDEIPAAHQRRMLSSPQLLRVPRKAPELPKEMEEFEVTEDYSKLVLRKRMKLGLSQEALAHRVKEKLSVIQKIELGKVAPNTKLCRGLEHELKIKLLIPRKEVVAPKAAALAEVTLGDIIHIKGKTQPSTAA